MNENGVTPIQDILCVKLTEYIQKNLSLRRGFLKVVGEEGFEPPTLWSQTRCATKLRYSPKLFIYKMGWLTRLELATTGITIRGSTN